MTYEVLHGDCRVLMAGMEGCSVDAIVTDPPYHLTSIVKRFGSATAAAAQVGATGVYARSAAGFMGHTWDGGDVAFDPATWAAALRVLKPGGHLLAFSGSRTYHRMVCAIEDAGFEIRDQLMWIYGSGFPKSKAQDGDFAGWGTALKPAHEPIVLARKPLIGSVAVNLAEHRTGAINVDGCRIGKADGDRHEYGVSGDEASNAGNGLTHGHRARVAYSPSVLGRWPANVLHDGSDDVVTAMPSSDSRGGAAKLNLSPSGYGGAWDGGNAKVVRNDAGSAARFFYCAKATKADRNDGLAASNVHPTVKPEALMRWLVRLITPPGGLVLDPFTGSGSTGKAAVLEGFDFVGCELTAEYLPIANARIAAAVARAEQAQAATPQYDMFDGAAA